MQNIILSCINIWNDFELYRVRNFFFTRMGVFPYHKEDDKRMDSQINAKSAHAFVDHPKAEVTIDTIATV